MIFSCRDVKQYQTPHLWPRKRLLLPHPCVPGSSACDITRSRCTSISGCSTGWPTNCRPSAPHPITRRVPASPKQVSGRSSRVAGNRAGSSVPHRTIAQLENRQPTAPVLQMQSMPSIQGVSVDPAPAQRGVQGYGDPNDMVSRLEHALRNPNELTGTMM